MTIGFNEDLVGLENDIARVCAIVKSPTVRCPANFSFDLLLTTNNADEDSAGNFGYGSLSF